MKVFDTLDYNAWISLIQETGRNPRVLDVITEIMKEKNRDIKQGEIIKEVLNKRQVKENTVILNLQNKKYFERLTGKTYRLK